MKNTSSYNLALENIFREPLEREITISASLYDKISPVLDNVFDDIHATDTCCAERQLTDTWTIFFTCDEYGWSTFKDFLRRYI